MKSLNFKKIVMHVHHTKVTTSKAMRSWCFCSYDGALKATTTGEDFLLTARETLASWEFGWEKMTSVTNDDGKNMYVSTPGAKTLVKKMLTASHITYVCEQASSVMNI
jgi:hypothetical protein